MILEELTIKNIRSYIDENISFREGSTLLSGDVGSGKSSILLAIEFALFGTSRPDLTSESLLRKGTNNGSVELIFSIGNKKVEILRSLKRSSRGINQGTGWIVVNGIKKELTPTELKAEIITLFGYPEEYLTKNKNYIFRYTVYCPQEEMKQILLESAENRLVILRKIFNVDKYQTIRDNLIPYLREQRKEIIVLETKLEPLEENERKKKEIENYIERERIKIQVLLPEKEKNISTIDNLRNILLEFEKKDKQLIFLKNSLDTKQLLINENNKIILRINDELENIQNELNNFSLNDNINLNDVNQEIHKLESEKTIFVEKKIDTKNKIDYLQQRIKILQEEISEDVNKQLLEKVLKEKEEIESVIVGKEGLEGELIKKQRQSLDINNQITEIKTLIQEKKKNLDKIVELNNCPTCLQEVKQEYKHDLCSKQSDESEQLMLKIDNLSNGRKIIIEEEGEIKKKLELIYQLDKRHSEVKIIIINYNEKISNNNILKQELLELVKKNNNLMSDLDKLNTENRAQVERIDQRLQQLKNIRVGISLKLEKHKQFEKNSEEKKKLKDQQNKYLEEINFIKKELELLSTTKEEINIEEIKTKLENNQAKEKDYSIELAKLQTNKLNQEQQLEKLNQLSSKFDKKKELYRWLNNYFLKLTYTIEKGLMMKIYHLFNQLFKEWFNILIEDSLVSARLDDSFTPIVEQNEHEIDFRDLSGGERTAVSLAYRLALNKVINDIVHNIKTKDLLILDEPTDGFSSEQLEKMHDLIDNLKLRQIIIVSHETKVESFVDQVLNIQKEEFISSIS